MKAPEEHRHKAPKELKIAIFTASTSRYEKKKRGEEFRDETGEKSQDILRKLGYSVDYLGVVNDDIVMIRHTLLEALNRDYDVIIINGGTGLAKRDVTIEAVEPFLEKRMDGFGEIIRLESYKRIGAAAAMTRAVAGVFHGKVIMALPGSPDAVETALTIFGKELPHMVFIARS
ncbi:MAG: MogA/MoaB family molybdenum cofactor biosynthesis protein [Aigarchaeota archaeon]|nr:MogA/MoaB family molybdenum cofactor biosynthesis protein [Candidatus Pelearchaeum maunauluense]